MLCIMGFTTIQAQTPACTPNQLYKDSAVGVYPLPRTTARPDAGITKAACLSTAYNFVFTIKADSFVYSGILLPLDSITVAKTGAVQGLPGGLGYACNPPSCAFKAKVLGCVVIQGTVADTNKIKDYPLVISGKAYVPVLGGIAQTFPSSTFPGDYTISVLAKGSAKCTSTPTEDLQSFVSALNIQPNPANEAIHVSFNVQQAGEYDVRVVNVIGATVLQSKINLINGGNEMMLTTSSLNNGLYFYALSKDNQTFTQKFVVNR